MEELNWLLAPGEMYTTDSGNESYEGDSDDLFEPWERWLDPDDWNNQDLTEPPSGSPPGGRWLEVEGVTDEGGDREDWEAWYDPERVENWDLSDTATWNWLFRPLQDGEYWLD